MRKRFKIPLVGIIVIVVAVVTGLVMLYQSHILENWVNRYLADQLAERYDLDVTIAEIDGSFVTGFTLRNILVRMRNEADTMPLAFLPQVDIKYSVSNIWHGRWIIDSVRLRQPHVYLHKDDSGQWVLPDIATVSAAEQTPPSWEIGVFRLEDGHFDIAVNGDSMSWFGINLLGTAQSEGGTHTLQIDTLRFDSPDERLRVRHAGGTATMFQKNIALEAVTIKTDSSQIDFSLVFDDKDGPWMEVDISRCHVHLPDVVSLLGANLNGDIDLAGTVYRQYGKLGGNLLVSGMFLSRSFDSLNGRFHYDEGILYLDTLHGTILDGCDIAGFGTLDFGSSPKGFSLSADIGHFDLSHLVFGSFVSDLSGDIILTGRGLHSNTMALDLDAAFDESYFDIYHVHAATGEMSISTKGLYVFPGFMATYHGNRFWFEGDVAYKGDVNVEGRADLSDLTAFTNQTFIDLPAGRATATFAFTGPASNPDLAGTLVSDSVWFYQFYTDDFQAEYEIAGFTTYKNGPITVRAGRGEAWKFPFDSIYSTMTLDSNLLLLDTLAVTNSFSDINANGRLDYEAYPQVLDLNELGFSLTGRRFHGEGTQRILVDSAGFIFDRIDIRGSDGGIEIAGRANFDETLETSWDIENVRIGPWMGLFSDSLQVGGRLSSTGKVSGPFINPLYTLSGSIDSLRYKNLVLGHLDAFLTYEDTTLYVDSSFLASADGLYTAEGDFPINLALTADHGLFDEREQYIMVHAEDKRLDLAAFVLESVEYITGDFTADITLSGKPLRPHLNGVSSLKNGIVKLIDLRDPLQQVEVTLEMSDKLVSIVRADARVPHKDSDNPGIINAGGTILINDINNFTYALEANCLDLPLNYELGDFTGMCDAVVYINGPTPPRVTGTITMHYADYRESFEEESGFTILTSLEADKTWNLDLMVDCPSNFWVKNDDVDAEFGGSLNIMRTAGVYNFLGTMEVIRGKFYLLDKTFRMTPGGEIVYENIEKLDPRLNLEIVTRIRTQPRFTGFETEDSYSYELPLLVTGTLENPIITPSGESHISSESMLPSILADADVGSSNADQNLSTRITLGGVGLLANQVSRIGTRSLGVETFEINPNFAGGFDPLGTQLTIGAYTLPNLYVFGSSYVDVDKGQEVGVEYRLSKHYLFEGRRDESNLYHFSFKFYWEY